MLHSITVGPSTGEVLVTVFDHEPVVDEVKLELVVLVVIDLAPIDPLV